MARSFSEIQEEIKVKIRTYPSLDAFKFPEEGGSSVSVFNTFIDVVSSMINLSEIIIDGFKEEITTIANRSFSGNSQWLRQQMLNFQFGDVITLDDDFVPVYPVVNPANRIITRVAVTDRSGGGVNIKVAKGVPPTLEPLDNVEIQAVKDYYFGTITQEGIGFAGIVANFISADPDRMKVGATIYYQGQFDETTVKTNVIAAIDNFFATFADDAFDGTIFMIRLTDAIQSVIGVTRIVYTDVKARDAATPFVSAQNVDFQGIYSTFAGYIIAEDEAGQTLDDTITMQLETV